MVNFGRGFNFDHWSVLTRNIYNGIVKRYPFSKLIGFDKDNDPHPHILLLKSKFWLKQDKTNYRDALECREVSSTGTTTGHLQGLLLHYLQNIVTTLVQRLLQRCIKRLTWNMCSMSWWICLKEGRLPSSQCQHSRMRLYTRAGQPGGHSMR